MSYNPNNVSFQAQLSATQNNVTGDGTSVTLVYDQVNWNYGGGYNNGSGIFTAPVAGLYDFSGTLCLTNLAVTHTQLLSQGVTPTIIYNAFEINPFNLAEVNTNLILMFAFTANLAFGGTVYFAMSVANGTKTVGIGGNPTFMLNGLSGTLIG